MENKFQVFVYQNDGTEFQLDTAFERWHNRNYC